VLPPVLLAAFPDLTTDDPVVTHPPNPRFNCVAWAAGVTDVVWWPADPDAFWPPGAPDELTVPAVVAALATVGYVPCADGGPEPGAEKVAVYARAGAPTHVARQLPDGRWSSKLGRDCTVSHATPGGVEGAVYGAVVAYLRRPVTPPRTA
jgi:hypothetical protein